MLHLTRHRLWLATALLVVGMGFSTAAFARTPVPAAAPAPTPSASPTPVPQSDLLNAQLWLQDAPEYKANAVGAYALGRLRLDQALSDRTWTAADDVQAKGYEKLPPAVIVDVDETVLDNSPYESYLALNNRDFSPKEWTAWCNAAEARAIPGSLAFLKYAASRHVEIFYITDRTVAEKDGTVRNLKALGYPMDPKQDTVLVVGQQPDWKSAKGTRFAYVARKYRVLLKFGDQLGDFVDDTSGDPAQRMKLYQDNMKHWGHDWIAIANPAYGNWESAPYHNNFHLSDDEKRKDKEDTLEQWKPPAM